MSNDDWGRSMNNPMKLKASLHPKIDLKITHANYDVGRLINRIEGFRADSLNFLIVSQVQSKPKRHLMPEFLFWWFTKTENQHYTAFLGADDIDIGRNAAKEIIVSNKKDAFRTI